MFLRRQLRWIEEVNATLTRHRVDVWPTSDNYDIDWPTRASDVQRPHPRRRRPQSLVSLAHLSAATALGRTEIQNQWTIHGRGRGGGALI